jgi:putative ABC transport system permease protein
MIQDLRFAARLLSKDRWFTLAAVLALALGIGANTTVFTLVNAVLIRDLPFDRANEIVFLATHDSTRPPDDHGPPSWHEFETWRERARSFAGMAAFIDGAMNISDSINPADRVRGASVSTNTFALLRQQPLMGRDFAAGEDAPGATPVVILGYDLWKNRYGSDAAILGRTLRIAEVTYTIVGVMPAGMHFPFDAQLWRPLLKPARPPLLHIRNVNVFARLAPGVAWGQAAAEMRAIATELQAADPAHNQNIEARVMTFNERFNGGRLRTVFLTLLGAVGFLLLIACANVANLLLARSSYRVRELAVRSSLGATRGRIVRQLLLESVLLAAVGGAFGLLLAAIGVQLFDRAVADVPKAYWIDFRFDPVVFIYCAAICITTGLAFGLVPALQVSKVNLNELMKDGARGAAGAVRARWLTSSLVVVELTLTLALLTGAGLMARSFLKLYVFDMGIETDHLLTMKTQLVFAKYPKPEQRRLFFETLEQRVAALPGVVGASVTTALPLEIWASTSVEVEGRPSGPAASGQQPVQTIDVTPRYFETMGISVVRGRSLTSTDGVPGNETVVVNQTFASQLLAGEEPIGGRIRLMTGPDQNVPGPWMTIAGVAANIRMDDIRSLSPTMAVYRPLQVASPTGAALAIRTIGDPSALTGAVREAARSLDPDQPLFDIRPMNEIIRRARMPHQIFGSLFVIFAAIALALASVGVYAITAYGVSQRTQEIGVRVALGAQPAQIRWLVLRAAIVQLGVGLGLGLMAAWLVSGVVGSLLVQIEPTDPTTFATAAALLIAVTLSACLIPAARATRLDPLTALRKE